jgi:hypothetical protein
LVCQVVSFAFFTPAITPPFAAHWSDTEPKFRSEIENRASVSPLPFRHCHAFRFRWFVELHFAHGSLSPQAVKRAANGRVTDSGFKKKLMKSTNSTIEASAPANVRPSSVPKAQAKHDINRALSTGTVLHYLRTRLPRQYEIAEVVGKWVWVDVSPAGKPALAKVFWTLGFHWNQRRGVWQHPCGSFNPLGAHPTDPRAKYRSFFPADVLPA